jgi:putative heme-binding domain-containing protein
MFPVRLRVKSTPDEIARLSKLVEKTGDPAKGRAIYTQDRKLACARCHRLEGMGHSLGPDLTRLWQTHSAGDVLLSLLDPDGNSSADYRIQKVTTKTGRTYLGLVLMETPEEVHLRDAGGREIHLKVEGIAKRVEGRTSLMTKPTVAALTEEELIHLVAFLVDRKAQESLRTEGEE